MASRSAFSPSAGSKQYSVAKKKNSAQFFSQFLKTKNGDKLLDCLSVQQRCQNGPFLKVLDLT